MARNFFLRRCFIRRTVSQRKRSSAIEGLMRFWPAARKCERCGGPSAVRALVLTQILVRTRPGTKLGASAAGIFSFFVAHQHRRWCFELKHHVLTTSTKPQPCGSPRNRQRRDLCSTRLSKEIATVDHLFMRCLRSFGVLSPLVRMIRNK